MVVAVLFTTVVDLTKAGLTADGALCVIGTLPTILEYLYRALLLSLIQGVKVYFGKTFEFKI